MSTFSVYHGTAYNFTVFEQSSARTKNDYYGGGVAYFTDNFNIAKQYAEASLKLTKSKGIKGIKLVYSVVLNIKKIFDVDDNFSGKNLLKFIGTNIESFARAAGLLKLGTDKYQIISDLKSGNMSMTGNDIFRGLSYGMQDVQKTANKLKQLGYDGLRYNGGLSQYGNIKHNVYVPYFTKSIKITNVKEV